MKINIDQVITRTKFRLKLTNSTLANAYLEKLIDEGARHLDKIDNYIVNCAELDIDCIEAKLPDHYDELLCFKFPGTSCVGCCETVITNPADGTTATIPSGCGCRRIFVANRQLLTNFCDTGVNACWWGNTFEVQNGMLLLPTSTTATTIKVWYKGANVDDDGIMVLDEDSERALSAYAAFQFAVDNFKKYDRYQIESWKREWVAQKNWLKGSAVKKDHQLHLPAVAAIANAIFLDPWLTADRNM